MLKELKLNHWKSFEEATFYIDPLTILIGANASGKSNLLDALLFLQRVSSGVGIFQAINGDVNLPPIRGGLEWVCRKPGKEFSLELILNDNSPSQDYKYELCIQINGAKAEVSKESLTLQKYGPRSKHPRERSLFHTASDEGATPGIPAYFSTGSQGRGKRIDLSRTHTILHQTESITLRKEVQEAVKLALSQLQQIFVFDPIPSHMRDYTPFSETLQTDGSNLAGVLSALESGRKNEVEDALTSYLKRIPERDIISIWAEPVGRFKTDAMLYCKEGWEGASHNVVDARGMSDGTLRYLAIVAAMLTRPRGGLLVIEEVDNGLHPSRARLLIEMLLKLGQERGIDVIVTTHNPALLDAAGPRMIPFITVAHRNDQTGASVLTQLEDVRQLPKLMAAGPLGRLSTEGVIEEQLKKENAS